MPRPKKQPNTLARVMVLERRLDRLEIVLDVLHAAAIQDNEAQDDPGFGWVGHFTPS